MMKRRPPPMIFAGIAVAVIGVGVAVNGWFGDRLDALPNELQHINGPLTFSFEWAPMKQGEVQIEQGALVLPVNIGGCNKFRMQLDTAAMSSHLVQSKMDNLAARCAVPVMVELREQRFARNMDINVGEAILYAPEIRIRDTGAAGIDWSNPARPELMGALAADLIENKWVVLDYPRKKLFIGDALPSEYSQPASWGNFTFKNRRLLFAAKLNGNDAKLLFDTGSPAFEVLTSGGNYAALATAGSKPQTYTINAWGAVLGIERSASDKTIDIAGATLPLKGIARTEDSTVQQSVLDFTAGIQGRVGNGLFLDKVLVLDMKAGKVGIAQLNPRAEVVPAAPPPAKGKVDKAGKADTADKANSTNAADKASQPATKK